MCGLFAILDLNKKISESDVQRAKFSLKKLEHRGPDDSGYFYDDSTFLGHHRLSIIDISKNGHQPMQSLDKSISLIFNGQIYNWREIRDELIKDGFNFKSNCDTESILNGYLKYGKDIFKKLVGMWSIIIWDSKSKELIVSRDRLGIKPLYIYEYGSKIIFSSEIKSIVNFLPKKLEVNNLVLERYIIRGWLDDVSETLYKGIKNFPQASFSIYNCKKKSKKNISFWKYPTPSSSNICFKSWKEMFITIVEQHIQSDAPLATTLSGGLDSNAFNSVIAKELGKANDINAFSLLAEDVPDESSLIDEAVKELGIKHEYIDIGKTNYIEEIDELIKFHDEPTYSAGQINQFVFRKQIKKRGFKVLLVGDGADEILAGYAKILPIFVNALMESKKFEEAEQTSLKCEKLTNLSISEFKKRVELFRKTKLGSRVIQEFPFGHNLIKNELLSSEIKLKFNKTHKNINRNKSGFWFYKELMDRITVDIPQVLRNEDRNGMANSIEVRPIFLDHRLYELSWKFPFELMMKEGLNKNILRKSLKNIIPSKILNNKKKFVRPGSVNFLVYNSLKKPIEDIITSSKKGQIWKNNLSKLFDKSCKKKDINEALVWMRFYMIERTLKLKF